MVEFTSSGGILTGARHRVAIALVPVALLWLAVLWAAFGGRAPGVPAAAPQAAPTLQAVVASGEASPIDGSFDRFEVEGRAVAAPANRRGDVVFFARLLRSAVEEGLFLSSGGHITKLVAVGDAMPGGERIAGFGEHPAVAINAAGTVAFSCDLTGGKATSGVFLLQNGRLTAVALSGAAAPDVSGGTLAQFEPPAINEAGDVIFLAALRRGRESGEAIYVWHRGQLTKRVASGDAVPGGGQFGSFGDPALDEKGGIAFGAVVEQGPILGGIFEAGRGQIRPVIAAGSAAPTGGVFARFSERISVNDSGAIALSAVLRQSGPAGAVFLIENDTPRTLAALGDSAPGGGSFAALASWPVISPAGKVAFVASLDGGPNGLAIFVADGDGLRRLAAVGDPLPDGGRIAAFPLYPAIAIAADDSVTFAATAERDGVRRDTIFYYGPPRARR